MWNLLIDAVNILGDPVFTAPSQYPIAGFGVDWALNILKGILEGLLEFVTNEFLGKVEKFLEVNPQAESKAVRERYLRHAKAAGALSPLILVIAIVTGPFYDAEEYSLGRLLYRYGVFLFSIPVALELIPIFMMTVNELTMFIYPSSVNLGFAEGGMMGKLQGALGSLAALVMGGYFIGFMSLVTAFIGLLGLQARELAYVALYIGFPFFALARIAPWGPLQYAASISRMFVFTCASLVMVGPLVALGVAAGSVLSGPGSQLTFWGRFLTWFLTLAVAGYIPLKTASSVSFTMGQLSNDSGGSGDSDSVRSEQEDDARSLRSQAGAAARRAGGRARQSFDRATGGRFSSATSNVKGAVQSGVSAAKGSVSDRAPDSLKSAADTVSAGASRAGDVGQSMAETAASNPQASLSNIADSGAQTLREDPVVEGGGGSSQPTPDWPSSTASSSTPSEGSGDAGGGVTSSASERGTSSGSSTSVSFAREPWSDSSSRGGTSSSGSSRGSSSRESTSGRSRQRGSGPYSPEKGGGQSSPRPKDRPPKMRDINFNP